MGEKKALLLSLNVSRQQLLFSNSLVQGGTYIKLGWRMGPGHGPRKDLASWHQKFPKPLSSVTLHFPLEMHNALDQWII